MSNVTRYFEDVEWAAFSNETIKRITEDPVRTEFLANKNRRTTSSVSAKKYNENQVISQIITGVQNSIHYESILVGVLIRLPSYGIRTQVSSVNRISASEIIHEPEELNVFTYDHLGKHIKSSWMSGLVPCVN